MAGFFEFGEYRFDSEKRLLWREGELVALPPKAAEVLSLLIENRGNLVERSEILEKVWSDTFVEEANVNYAISVLRKTLGGDGIIQTIPRRGYRFAAEVNEKPIAQHQEIILERRTISETLIEERDDEKLARPFQLHSRKPRTSLYAAAAVILAGILVGGAYWKFTGRSAAAIRASLHSIAVLPLKGFSSSADDQELRLKITDSVITRLGSTDKVVVRPTSSVMRYSDPGLDILEAGRAMKVDAVVDGRVQMENGRLRVNLQLISVADGEQIWSGQFDGRTGDLLGLQDQIATRFQRDLGYYDFAPASRAAGNRDAYEAYLKGRFLWNQRKKESYFAALEYFNKSIELDPNFALGYTGISDSYHLLQQRNAISTQEAFAKAEPSAMRALELDPNLAEAYVSMGSVNFIRYSRWEEAEKLYRRAIELNPNLPEAYARLGMLLNAWGRFDEALAVLKKAEELDPTSVNNAIYVGANYYFSKQFDRAAEQFIRILEFAPTTERAHFFLERIYEINGQYDKAVEHALLEQAVVNPSSVEILRSAYERQGIKGFWKKQIDVLIEQSQYMFGLENHIASRYALLGDTEKACDFVEKNLTVYGTMWNYGRVDPLFDPIRNEARFKNLMERYKPSV
jgi:DNA-binding winged helix-turn-helix (wHTH) protein/tetratricopeptide (TPR) repeat protein